jgi:lipopolysaccharide transport system ATP-binding protein
MAPIIRVENLSKQYRIGARQTSYLTLREQVAGLARSPLNWFRRNGRSEDNTIWALKDVSFEVMPGEVLGVIGRNGAGKSTLLKILSRVTEPTTGQVDLYGRVGSLLEVGTGFHPELTGRENVRLSGAILGMRRPEIQRKFDEIVAFAEIEKFIDTPVKYYSSGMYTRLAFAVAAHLEPEILVVDEVLAVGDLAFQQKCLNHMKKLTGSGMTIIIVSHNMAAIQSSSDRAILMQAGTIRADGNPLEVIEIFRNVLSKEKDDRNVYNQDGTGANRDVEIEAFEMFGEDGVSKRSFRFGERVRIKVDVHARRRIENPFINFGIKRSDGVIACNFNNWYDGFKLGYLEGRCTLEGWLPQLRLIPDLYEIHVLVWPWGGGHTQGDLTTAAPLAAATFGDFSIYGLGLNAHDGVFQTPSVKWRFTRDGHIAESSGIADDAIYQVFQDKER